MKKFTAVTILLASFFSLALPQAMGQTEQAYISTAHTDQRFLADHDPVKTLQIDPKLFNPRES